jgi:uncharacterized membrane protein
MPTQQPSLSHKKWFETLYIINVLFIFLLSFTGVFSGPNGYYYMGICGAITIGFIIYSLIKGFSDWKLIFLYLVIAIILGALNFLNIL